MNITRRQLLATSIAAAGAAGLPCGARIADASGTPKHLIVVYAYGGWDTTYALDPKPGLSAIDVPAGTVREFGDLSIFTDASRPAVTAFFERYAGASAVLNGLQMQSIVHPDNTKRLLTGTASETNPDMATLVAQAYAVDLPAPYLALGPSAFTGPFASIATRAGTVNQIRSLLTPDAAFPPADPTVPIATPPSAAEAQLIRDYVRNRAQRTRELIANEGINRRKLDDFMSSLERSDVVKGFADGFGDDFTFTLDIREQIALGLGALQRGVSYCLHLEQAFAQWDTHANNAAQGSLHDDLFDALTFLASELERYNLFDDTVVAVVSEMGRTPKLNAGLGKDHWPVSSALVFGGGIKSGTYGQSTDELLAGNVSFETGAADEGGQQLQYGNFAAGLLHACGVDSEPFLPGSEPFRAFVA